MSTTWHFSIIILLDLNTKIKACDKYRAQNSLRRILQLSVTFSFVGPNIFLSTKFSRTPSAWFSFNFGSTFHTHSKYKIIVVCVLFHALVKSNWRGERFWTEWLKTFPSTERHNCWIAFHKHENCDRKVDAITCVILTGSLFHVTSMRSHTGE